MSTANPSMSRSRLLSTAHTAATVGLVAAITIMHGTCIGAEDATCIRLQIATCGTKQGGMHKFWNDTLHINASAHHHPDHGFLAPINLCAGKVWRGFGWKLQHVADFARKLLNDSAAGHGITSNGKPCSVVVFFVDANDVLINRVVSHSEAVERWRSLRADIAISTEMTCFVGELDLHACTG